MSINGQLAVTALGCQGSHAPPFQELGKLNELTVLVLSQEWNVDLPVQSIVVLYDSGSNINSGTGKCLFDSVSTDHQCCDDNGLNHRKSQKN